MNKKKLKIFERGYDYLPVDSAVHDPELSRPEHLVREDLVSFADLRLPSLLLLLRLLHRHRLGGRVPGGRRGRGGLRLLGGGSCGGGARLLAAGLHHGRHGGPDRGLELCHGLLVGRGVALGLEISKVSCYTFSRWNNETNEVLLFCSCQNVGKKRIQWKMEINFLVSCVSEFFFEKLMSVPCQAFEYIVVLVHILIV